AADHAVAVGVHRFHLVLARAMREGGTAGEGHECQEERLANHGNTSVRKEPGACAAIRYSFVNSGALAHPFGWDDSGAWRRPRAPFQRRLAHGRLLACGRHRRSDAMRLLVLLCAIAMPIVAYLYA